MRTLAKCETDLKVVDRLERVYAPNLTVLEPEEHRFEVLSGVTRVLADQKEVWLEQTARIMQFKIPCVWPLF